MTENENRDSASRALVFGGSRGIGRATCLALAAAGNDITFTYSSNEQAAQDTKSDVAALGVNVECVRADLASIEATQTAFDLAAGDAGLVDIVVVNAALGPVLSVVDTEPEDFDKVFAVNARGVFFALREAARRVSKDGRILVVSSAGTGLFVPDMALYLGSKGAVEQFVRVLSREVASRGITVNVVSPGPTDTDLLPERDRAGAPALSAFGRLGTPEDVADVITFLATPESRWITGQNIRATGGVI